MTAGSKSTWSWRSLLIALSFSVPMANGALAQGAGTTPVVEITARESVVVKKFVAGGNVVDTMDSQKVLPEHETYIEQLSPSLLRVPSGFHANYYFWDIGQFVDLDNKPSADYDYSLAQLFERPMRLGIPVTYVVNVARDTPTHSRQLASTIKARGYRVAFWELGNELASPDWAATFPSADEYLVAAKAHAGAIRTVFPDARFGVTTQNESLLDNLWNHRLAEQTDFINIIIHRYIGIAKEVREGGLDHEINLDKAFEVTLNSSDDGALGKIFAAFPGKQFWFSEFGFLYIGSDYQNSMGQAIWMSRLMMEFLREYPVKMAAYWDYNAKPFESYWQVDDKVVRRIPYFVLKYFGKAVSEYNNTAAADLKIDGVPLAHVKAQLFTGGNTPGQITMIVSNGSGTSAAFRLPSKYVLQGCYGIGADSFTATNGTSKAFPGGPASQVTEEIVITKSWVPYGSTIELPPYGVGVVVFKDTTISQ